MEFAILYRVSIRDLKKKADNGIKISEDMNVGILDNVRGKRVQVLQRGNIMQIQKKNLYVIKY